jgi:hypothetical protein
MKKYFYTDGANSFGPFTLEELREKNITRETKVWFQELGEWKSAGSVSELNEIFKLAPPPIIKTNINYGNMENVNNRKPPKTWLAESILATIFCCFPFGIVGIVNAAKVESRFYAGDIYEADRLSKEAKKWTMVSFWVGLSVAAIYLIFMIVAAADGFY